MFRKDLVLIGLLVCILALMVLPLSPAVIDVLLAVNMSLSIMLLLVGIYLKNPSDFSTFPSVILIGTAFRLALSIGTTRLILTEAEGGEIITTFGKFVVGGYVAVGLVIFLVITVVQFLVVTKGAERVAEVAARFALDAMPGKQMSIDADVRAGTIDAATGEKMRQQLNKESQFFGSMDGAMKFIKGDAIAGLIIVAINLIGGMVVGVAIHGMTFSESAALFSLLTVGDGLVAQIPALLMALCAGVIVTRATGPDNVDLGSDIGRELAADARVPGVASILVFGMGMIPGFPTVVFSVGGAALAGVALFLARRKQAKALQDAEQELAGKAEQTQDIASPAEAPVEAKNQRFRVCLGEDLAGRLDVADMQRSLDAQFSQLCQRTGVHFATPEIVIQPHLGAMAVSVELDDVPLFAEFLSDERILFAVTPAIAIAAGAATPQALHWPTLEGVAVTGTGAMLLEAAGHTPIAVQDALLEQAFRLFERNIGALFSRREFELLMQDFVTEDAAGMAVVEQASKRATLFQVFQTLVEDGVPLRPARLVIEALHYWTQMPEITTAPLMSDCLRGSLKRQMCHALVGPEGMLGIVLMDPEFESALRKQTGDIRKSPSTAGFEGLPMPTEMIEPALAEFRRIAMAKRDPGHHVVVVIGADLRRRLRNFLAANNIQLPVFAPHELPPEVRTFPVEVLRMPISGNTPRLSRVA
jgi:type III secretion protein V